MKRKSSAADAAAQEAAGRSADGRIQKVVVLVSPYAQGAANRVIPLARAAGGRAAPLGREAMRRVSPYGKQAAVLLVPYAQQAAGRVGPMASSAKERGSQAAQEAVKAMGPKLDDAYLRLTPVVVAARGKVNEDLVPRLSEAWTAAAAAPVVVEATKRGRAAMAAARGELTLPEVVTKKKGSWPKRLAVFSAAAGVGVVVARKLLGSHDADWTAATPKTFDSTAPSSAPSPAPSHGGIPTMPIDETPTMPIDETPAVSADERVEPVVTLAPADSTAPSIGDDVSTDDLSVDRAAGADAKYSGDGVYVGSEPPEGFILKGDETTMTFCPPESANYAESRADVWFTSAEAAHQAGFSPDHD
jgi:hypothetical protein